LPQLHPPRNSTVWRWIPADDRAGLILLFFVFRAWSSKLDSSGVRRLPGAQSSELDAPFARFPGRLAPTPMPLRQ